MVFKSKEDYLKYRRRQTSKHKLINKYNPLYREATKIDLDKRGSSFKRYEFPRFYVRNKRGKFYKYRKLPRSADSYIPNKIYSLQDNNRKFFNKNSNRFFYDRFVKSFVKYDSNKSKFYGKKQVVRNLDSSSLKTLNNKNKASFRKAYFNLDLSFLKKKMILSKKRMFRSVSTAVAVGHNINIEDVYSKQFFLNFAFEDIQKKFINVIMKDGKKALARFLYKMSIFIIKGNVKKRFKFVLQKALLNVCPFFYYKLEFRSGRIFKFPKYISETFRIFLGIKYMVESVKKGVSNFYSNFAYLLFQTSFGKGEAVRKKKDLYQMLVDFRALHRFRSFFSFPYFRFRHNFFFSKRKKRLFRHYKSVNRARDYFTLSYIKKRVKNLSVKKNTFFTVVVDRFKVVKRILLSYFFHSFYFFNSFDYKQFRFNVTTLWGILGFLRYVVFFDAYHINVINPVLIINYMFYIVNLNITITFINLFDILWKLLSILQLQFLKLYNIIDNKFKFIIDKSYFVDQDTDFFHLINGSFVSFKYNQVKYLLLGDYYPQFLDTVQKYSVFYQNKLFNVVSFCNLKRTFIIFTYISILKRIRLFLNRVRRITGIFFFVFFVKPFFNFIFFNFKISLYFLLYRRNRENVYEQNIINNFNEYWIEFYFYNIFKIFITTVDSSFRGYINVYYQYFRAIFLNYVYLYSYFMQVNIYYDFFNRFK